MKSKSTILWFMIAATLAAAIWLADEYFKPRQPEVRPLFDGLQPGAITSIQITPAGGREISVTGSNHVWLIEKPIFYPAQKTAIEGFLSTLQKLTPIISFSAGEMSSHNNAGAEFGFDNPQVQIDLSAGEQSWHLLVGNKTAPGDGVYVRMVGTTGAFVLDTAWLGLLPHDVSTWRDTTLVTLSAEVDSLIVTNGTQPIELVRDVTNRLWRMIRPIAARANNLRIATGLQQLEAARVTKFVTDDPKADLAAYGLEPAALDVWFGKGTNLLTAVHMGKEAGTGGDVYARRDQLSSIVTTPKTSLLPWQGTLDDFRDPYLFEASAPISEIVVNGDFNFALQLRWTNTWSIAGEKFPVDAVAVASLIQSLGRLKIANYVQDVVTATGLKDYGLAPNPQYQITLRSTIGDTNHNIVHLLFGTTNNQNQIFVKREDEPFVYALPLAGLDILRLSGDYFRDHPIWSFSETNVVQMTLRQNGKLRQLTRTGVNEWSFASGSQGIINPPAVEETVHRLGELSASAWFGRDSKSLEAGGITTNSLSITVELKSGEKYSVTVGSPMYINNGSIVMGAVNLDGERWGFIFPPTLYPLVSENLIIPAETP